MTKQALPGLRMMLLMTLLTGLVYPGVVTGLCQVLFPVQANGSLVRFKGRVVGAELIGQDFTRPQYFHPRPSAAGMEGYDAAASGGSNLGPTSQVLVDRVRGAADKFHSENPEFRGRIPADLLTTSGSGLDPHVSPASAEAQVERVAAARGMSREKVAELVRAFTERRDLGVLGEPRVNVLKLNLALEENSEGAKTESLR
ncbi:MAG: potassium-transporting ATPase subunit KdpC [Acidobacteria bacterium]|nr:potassium-transporting ATPase subunit KdpC [Acidobacteriota bacterium]